MSLYVLKANLWDLHAKGDWCCITTNGAINSYGKLVMGRGCAKEAAIKFDGLAEQLACRVRADGNHVYSVSTIKLLTFPVKHHWAEAADLKLIRRSAEELANFADTHQWPLIYLPRPGCGNGRLNWGDVELEAVWNGLLHKIVIVDFEAPSAC